MKVICAWCGKFIGGDPNGTEISHGICDKCHQEMLKQIKK